MKIVVAGDSGVGKTSFVRNIKKIPFDKKFSSTIGCEVHPFTNGSIIDTAGNEKYTSSDVTLRNLCNDANIIILMFDVTHKKSYINLNKWYNYYKNINSNIPIIIIGNKTDSENRIMNHTNTTFHIENTLQYFEISSKTGHNINTVMNYITTHF